MALSKLRIVASGLAVAGLAAAVGLGYAAPHLGKALLASIAGQHALVEAAQPDGMQLVADKGAAPAAKADARRNVLVEAPHTSVKVAKDSGKVAVTAPHTDVKVDPTGRVQVRAPYVNLDIRW